MAGPNPDTLEGTPVAQPYPRSGQGPAYDPVTGQPYSTENLPQGNPQNQAAAEMQQAVPDIYNFDQQTLQQYEGDLFKMTTAGRPNEGQLILPPGVGAGEFANLETNLDLFAASAGYRYYPTAGQITQMLQQGLGTADQQQVFQWLSKVNGVTNAMPWAATGQTKTQYDNQKDTLEAQMAEYTGDPSMYGELLQQAMSRGSSASSWLTTQLTTNTKYTKNDKTPWLQYGMTYQSFKQQAAQQAGKIRSIYGTNATLAQQAEALGNPKSYTSGASGSAIATSSASTGPLVTPGGRSSVR